jgi:hypothetical protein
MPCGWASGPRRGRRFLFRLFDLIAGGARAARLGHDPDRNGTAIAAIEPIRPHTLDACDVLHTRFKQPGERLLPANATVSATLLLQCVSPLLADFVAEVI